MASVVDSTAPEAVDADEMASLLERLFDLFDADSNGIVDKRELSAGLSVLCKGNRDAKVHYGEELLSGASSRLST